MDKNVLQVQFCKQDYTLSSVLSVGATIYLKPYKPGDLTPPFEQVKSIHLL
jgi:hypothetical protein